MDLESTLSTIGDMLPEDLDIGQIVSSASDYLPDQLEGVIRHAARYVPTELELTTALQFLLYFSVASLVLGVLGRVVLGRRSSLNHSLSSVMGILFVYAVTIVVFTFKPWELHNLLSPLPFVTLSGDYLIILPMMDTQLPALCSELLALVILAFLVNLLDTFMPKGKDIISWYILRFITVVLAMGLHIVVRWAFHTYLPDVLVTYAPGILLALLAFMVLAGLLNLVLGLVLTIMNPFMGAMYTFFFSNIIGKQISKAIFSAAIVCGVFYCLNLFGFTVIHITAAALAAYIPLVIVLLLLWYLIGHVL
ncbi:MAG: hypothetical protein Q4F17_05545 [Eubacteriales bacterium]|nr:hypothetical protein [Eubacteriales bacterium]